MTDTTVVRPPLDPVLTGLLDRYGERATLVALMRTIIRHRWTQLHARRATRRATNDLSPHLRRDIGFAEPAPGNVPWPGLFL
ncbi:MAG: DUF1127 domain-containing protein [Maritimibacter sp.]